MIDVLTNPELIDYVKANPGVSDLELELADRLQTAIEEIEILVRHLDEMEAADGGHT